MRPRLFSPFPVPSLQPDLHSIIQLLTRFLVVRLAHSLGYAHSFAHLCSYYILYFFISTCCIPSFELHVAGTYNFTNYPSLACCLHSARPLARTIDAVYPFGRTHYHRAISRLLLSGSRRNTPVFLRAISITGADICQIKARPPLLTFLTTLKCWTLQVALSSKLRILESFPALPLPHANLATAVT